MLLISPHSCPDPGEGNRRFQAVKVELKCCEESENFPSAKLTDFFDFFVEIKSHPLTVDPEGN